MGMSTTKKRKRSTSTNKSIRKRESTVQKRARHVGAIGNNLPEVKNFDQRFVMTTSTSLPGWSSVRLINGCVQGTSKNDRIGNKYDLKSVFLRVHIQWASAVTQPCNLGPFRFAVIWDQAPNKGSPLATDIWAEDSIFAPVNLDNSDRFIIVADKILPNDIGLSYTTDPVRHSYFFDIYKSFGKKGWQVHMSGNSGGATSMNTGSLWVMVCNSVRCTSATVTNVECDTYSRIRFTDS